MNKYLFLFELRKELSYMAPEDRESAVRYYEEYFAEAGAENEQVIIDSFVSPAKLAGELRTEYEQDIKEPSGMELSVPERPEGSGDTGRAQDAKYDTGAKKDSKYGARTKRDARYGAGTKRETRYYGSGTVKDAAKDAADAVKDAAKDIAGTARDAAKYGADSAKGAAKDAAGAARDVAKDVAGSVKDAAKDAADAVRDAVKGTAGAFDSGRGREDEGFNRGRPYGSCEDGGGYTSPFGNHAAEARPFGSEEPDDSSSCGSREPGDPIFGEPPHAPPPPPPYWRKSAQGAGESSGTEGASGDGSYRRPYGSRDDYRPYGSRGDDSYRRPYGSRDNYRPYGSRGGSDGEKQPLGAGSIVAIVLLSIFVGIPVAAALFALVVAVFAVTLGLGVSLVAAAVVCVIAGVTSLAFLPNAMLAFGAACVLGAIGLPTLFGGISLTRNLVKSIIRGFKKIGAKLTGKEVTEE